MRTAKMSRSSVVMSIVLCGLGSTWATEAKAQQITPLTSVALSRFEPSERGSRFFYADSLELHHSPDGVSKPTLITGVTSSYANSTSTFGSLREGQRPTLVEHALYVHPGASVVLNPGARLALDVPVIAYQKGEDTTLDGRTYFAPASPSIGDIRISFDLRFLGPASRERDGFALAGGVSAWLPTGRSADYSGDDGARFGVHVTSAYRAGVLLASVRAGYMYRREGWFGGSRVGSELYTTAGLGFSSRGWTVGPELRGSTVIDAAFGRRTTPVEVVLGAHKSIFESFRVGAGLGTGLFDGMGAANFRGMLSIEWSPSPIDGGSSNANASWDRDGDGVGDFEDACPDVRGEKDAPANRRGCPNAPNDRDRDGVPDDEDACPDVPGTRTSNRTTCGCPNTPLEPEPATAPIEPTNPEPTPEPESPGGNRIQ